jgi:hypothetical protein
VLEYCANSELHPASAGLGVLSGQHRPARDRSRQWWSVPRLRGRGKRRKTGRHVPFGIYALSLVAMLPSPKSADGRSTGHTIGLACHGLASEARSTIFEQKLLTGEPQNPAIISYACT